MTDLSGIVKAYDVRGVVGEELDDAVVRDIGAALARLLREEDATTQAVVVGYDMRDSSPGLAAAFAEGVTGQGVDVVSIGLASTDMLYYASGALGLPGAMFTASHNPARYNGIKLCRAGATPVGQDTGLAAIRTAVEAGVPEGPGGGGVTQRDMLAGYADLPAQARRPLRQPTAEGRCRRGQRHGGPHGARRARRPAPRRRAALLRARRRRSPTTRPTRSTRPTSSTCRSASSTRAPTSASPSTATPTAASPSTSAASR